MTKAHEKLLVGTLAGIIIAGAAAFAIQPALAGRPGVGPTPSVAAPAVLSLRLGPQSR